jgi:hypothetical protein
MIQGTIEERTAADAESGIADWKRAHTELVRLAALRASLDWDEGRWLLSALRFGAHLKLGFASFLGRKCSVPGCRHGQYLDLHHVKPRAEGGEHDPEMLVTLCGVHHRAAHVGSLVVTGNYSSGFVFRHADGKRYGSAVSPETCELRQKVFLGLKGLGFRESDARRAIETATSGAGVGEPWTTETLLRKTLALLTSRAGRC